jgi:hypothetical protein
MQQFMGQSNSSSVYNTNFTDPITVSINSLSEHLGLGRYKQFIINATSKTEWNAKSQSAPIVHSGLIHALHLLVLFISQVFFTTFPYISNHFRKS